jgi:hypothetical protein
MVHPGRKRKNQSEKFFFFSELWRALQEMRDIESTTSAFRLMICEQIVLLVVQYSNKFAKANDVDLKLNFFDLLLYCLREEPFVQTHHGMTVGLECMAVR